MKYTSQIWKERHRHRSDLSTYVTHLTKAKGNKSTYDVLIDILSSGVLKGSATNGYIVGDIPAVCFQDMPMHGVAQNVYHEQLNMKELGNEIRYYPIGICFPKRYFYSKGGRPVFYEKKEAAKKILPKEEWWRIVSFDLSNKDSIVDWTHEREWRIKGDFHFESKYAIVIIPNLLDYTRLSEMLIKNNIEIGGVITLDPILS